MMFGIFTTKNLLCLSLGNTICEEILRNSVAQDRTPWDRLWEPIPFFDRFKHFLQVEVTAANKEDFEKWEGWVGSRMRLLIRSAGTMLDVRPWPKALKPPLETLLETNGNGLDAVRKGLKDSDSSLRTHPSTDELKSVSKPPLAKETEGSDAEGNGDSVSVATMAPKCFYFMGLSKKRPQSSYQYGQALVIPQSKVDLTAVVNEFAHKVKEWPDRKPGMEIYVKYVLQKDLAKWVKNFTEQTASGDSKSKQSSESSQKSAAGSKKRSAAGTKAASTEPTKKRSAVETNPSTIAVAAVERLEDVTQWTAPGEAGKSTGI